MPVREKLTLYQANDETVAFVVTQDDTKAPQNLTGVTVELYFKPSEKTADTDPAVTKLTTPTDIVVTDAAAGKCTASVPASALAAAGSRWWRLDCIVSGKRRTAMYGPLLVMDT